ncbi:chloroplast thylakoid lumen protein isoform X2 [Tasmannia lanceolata]|uniref:chloroplast thylakoid lumen protein isoform X2 n=1 Tax=Tasmannia lanceolata TaxID=3420 RepID=UPI004063D75C
MARAFFTLTNTLFPTFSSSSSSSFTTSIFPRKPNGKRPTSHISVICKETHDVSRRELAICLTTFTLSLKGKSFLFVEDANAAILEADDDVELLEKVKRDRKKRLQRQEVVNSSKKETGYLQELVYKLSKVGQAIDNNDLSAASSVLGPNANSDWVQNVNRAFTKLSFSPEEKTELLKMTSNPQRRPSCHPPVHWRNGLP